MEKATAITVGNTTYYIFEDGSIVTSDTLETITVEVLD